MRRRRKSASHANHERWLVSYADFITLLFAFFVVLYASSQVDKRKVGKLAMAIQVAFQEMGVFQASTTQVPLNPDSPMPFNEAQAVENVQHTASLARIVSRPDGVLGGGPENGDLAQLETELKTVLAAEIKRQEIAMRREPDGLVISLREVGFFESGSAEMKSASQLRVRPHRHHAPAARLSFADRGPHRRRPHSYRPLLFQLGTLHLARHGDRSAPDCARRFCAGSPQCGRICRVSPDCLEWHGGGAGHESPRRHCDPGPCTAFIPGGQHRTAIGTAVAGD